MVTNRAWCTICYWSVAKAVEACILAEGCHSEHLLWHCLPDIPVATCHNRLFSEPTTLYINFYSPTKNCINTKTREGTQQTSVRRKRIAFHKLEWRHFQVGWASWLQFVFFWDNVNNQKYVWIILLKMTFWISQGKVATSGYIWQVMWTNL